MYLTIELILETFPGIIFCPECGFPIRSAVGYQSIYYFEMGWHTQQNYGNFLDQHVHGYIRSGCLV